jgi:serine phosphatase RsbU (regulator of sigma subunit)
VTVRSSGDDDDRTDAGAASSELASAWKVWAEDRLHRLQRVSLELNAALSIDDVAASVIDALDAPVAAPSRSLYLLDEVGERLDLVAHRGMPSGAAAMFQRIPLSGDLPGAVAVRERRTVVSTGRVQAVEEFAGLRGAPRSTNGFVAIPLVSNDACVGVLGIGVDDELDARDLDFLEAIGAQVAQSITRVRLSERERRHRAQLEFMAQLTAVAIDATNHVDLMRRVCTAAVPTLGDWCSLYYLPETGGSPLIECAHIDPVMQPYVEAWHRRNPFDTRNATGAAAVIRTGATKFVPSLTPDAILDAAASSGLARPEGPRSIDGVTVTSAITVPLRTKRRIVGAIEFVSGESNRHYTEDDIALAEAVAERVATALDSAWIADHQRSVAVTLQRAFLPPILPMIPGVDLVARYWPAGIDEVGGDFYDVFELEPGVWAMLIGDVCGTGPDAAALTAIARHTVRAAARHGHTPDVVVEWLNEAVLQSNRHQFCTACYITLTAKDDRWFLTSTAAGHPLPIISTADGAVPFGRPGSLVGVLERVTVRTERTELHRGDCLVLYTDGFTDLPPPLGISSDELAQLVQTHRGTTANEIARAIHQSLDDRVPDHRRRDDAALLVLVVE